MLIRGVFISFISFVRLFLYFLVISLRLLCVSTLLYCTSRVALAGVDILLSAYCYSFLLCFLSHALPTMLLRADIDSNDDAVS